MKNKTIHTALGVSEAIQAICEEFARGPYVVTSVSAGAISASFVEDRRAVKGSAMVAVGVLGLLAKSEKTHPVTVVVSARAGGSQVLAASDHGAAFHDIQRAVRNGERELDSLGANTPPRDTPVTSASFIVPTPGSMPRRAPEANANEELSPPEFCSLDFHPDPTGRHELRFWDGRRWTDAVVDGDTESRDPLP